MSKFSVGDIVQEECHRGFGSGGKSVVDEIKTVYNEETGEPLEIVRVGDSWYYDTSGESYKYKTMYYIYKIS